MHLHAHIHKYTRICSSTHIHTLSLIAEARVQELIYKKLETHI